MVLGSGADPSEAAGVANGQAGLADFLGYGVGAGHVLAGSVTTPPRAAPLAAHSAAQLDTEEVADGDPKGIDPGDAVLEHLDCDAPDAQDSTSASLSSAALAALVGRVVYHDEAAFEQLYRALCTRVFRQAQRLTRNTATAEEVVEDVFWQVWREAPRFDPARGPVVAWVLQIARSRALDALRALGRNPLYDALDIDDPHRSETAADTATPQALLDQAQVARQIAAAMATLAPLPRQLVALAFQRGYSQSEIAEQTGLALGTVKSHLRRALATMKLYLDPTPSTKGRQP
jgi:RNA polymerase sigma-70 factor (ECF subfamily)